METKWCNFTNSNCGYKSMGSYLCNYGGHCVYQTPNDSRESYFSQYIDDTTRKDENESKQETN